VLLSNITFYRAKHFSAKGGNVVVILSSGWLL